MNFSISAPPSVAPVPLAITRPRWSIMIPTFNCAKYLKRTLDSVLAQDPGVDQMQIEVVDDCSTKDDPEGVVQKVGKGRVLFHRKAKNEGAVENFNTCIGRSCGHLVHILHGDDIIRPGFYNHITQIASRWPHIALYSTRSYFINEEDESFYVNDRVPSMETPGKNVEPFFYSTPIQASAVVVRRTSYEKVGAFLPQLVHAADREMWCRVVAQGGGVVSSEILACYRVFADNDTGRLQRLGENVLDIERINTILAFRYGNFDVNKGAQRVRELARDQAKRFEALGDKEAAKRNLDIWRSRTSIKTQLRDVAQRFARRLGLQ